MGETTITWTATDANDNQTTKTQSVRVILSDSDADGLLDSLELLIIEDNLEDSLTTYKDVLPEGDYDEDGLTNQQEFEAGTNPTLADTDEDGLSDGFEVEHNYDPLVPDDASTDEDNDGLTLLQEFQNSTNPKSNDTDNDGIPDGFEVQYGLNPTTNDATGDLDGDGINNLAYLYWCLGCGGFGCYVLGGV